MHSPAPLHFFFVAARAGFAGAFAAELPCFLLPYLPQGFPFRWRICLRDSPLPLDFPPESFPDSCRNLAGFPRRFVLTRQMPGGAR